MEPTPATDVSLKITVDLESDKIGDTANGASSVTVTPDVIEFKPSQDDATFKVNLNNFNTDLQT